MATPSLHHLTAKQARNERYLSWVEAMVAEIPLTAEEWPNLPGGERAGFAAEWDNYMGMVETVIGDHRAGNLMDDQATRLFQLVEQIIQLRPLLDAMMLHGPDPRELAKLQKGAEGETVAS